MEQSSSSSLLSRKRQQNTNPFISPATSTCVGYATFVNFHGKIKEALSLEQNPHLAANWEKFLNGDRHGPNVKLYTELVEDCKRTKPAKRYKLNGELYDRETQKMNPVPVDSAAVKLRGSTQLQQHKDECENSTQTYSINK